MTKRIIIIGGGPGGYVAAIRGAQLGAQVTLIEKDTLGGTCLNRGCIPTKALLQSADILAEVRNATTFGILAEKVSIDFSMITKRKEAVVKQLVNGVASLMKKNKIEVIKGTGTLIDSRTVEILEKGDRIKADSIIVATGSKPSTVPIKGIDQLGVMTSDEALTMEQFPSSILIIGGGVIGLEFAQIMHRMGSTVTIIEMMPQILPTEDAVIANLLQGIFEEDGIEIFTGATITDIKSAEKEGEVVSFTTRNGERVEERMVQKVLLAAGRRPNSDDLRIDKLGIATDKGNLIVNKRMETNIPGIYAIGDVVGGSMLAHVAMGEGKCAAENIMGGDLEMDYRAVPRCVYTSPEIATVGLTEAEAKKEYGDIRVGKFPFIANGRAMTLNAIKGMVRIIADARYGQILGVQILGSQATELIAEATLAIRLEATFDDIASTMHPHPTLSEVMMEAALNVREEAIHF